MHINAFIQLFELDTGGSSNTVTPPRPPDNLDDGSASDSTDISVRAASSPRKP